jgi:hypothetical protein
MGRISAVFKADGDETDKRYSVSEWWLIEPRGVLNTGHEGGERTAANDVWI